MLVQYKLVQYIWYIGTAHFCIVNFVQYTWYTFFSTYFAPVPFLTYVLHSTLVRSCTVLFCTFYTLHVYTTAVHFCTVVLVQYRSFFYSAFIFYTHFYLLSLQIVNYSFALFFTVHCYILSLQIVNYSFALFFTVHCYILSLQIVNYSFALFFTVYFCYENVEKCFTY